MRGQIKVSLICNVRWKNGEGIYADLLSFFCLLPLGVNMEPLSHAQQPAIQTAGNKVILSHFLPHMSE